MLWNNGFASQIKSCTTSAIHQMASDRATPPVPLRQREKEHSCSFFKCDTLFRAPKKGFLLSKFAEIVTAFSLFSSYTTSSGVVKSILVSDCSHPATAHQGIGNSMNVDA